MSIIIDAISVKIVSKLLHEDRILLLADLKMRKIRRLEQVVYVLRKQGRQLISHHLAKERAG